MGVTASDLGRSSNIVAAKMEETTVSRLTKYVVSKYNGYKENATCKPDKIAFAHPFSDSMPVMNTFSFPNHRFPCVHFGLGRAGTIYMTNPII